MNLYETYKQMKDVRVTPNLTNDLFIVKYNNLGVDFTNELVRQARGLVIDINGNIIARPFEKFFNLNENIAKESSVLQELSAADEGAVEVYDKLDGSLVIAFYHDDKLTFASSGSLKSEHVDLFNEYFNSLDEQTQIGLTELSKTYTLLFEYTGPNNQIVIAYNKIKMSLLGMINTQTGEDLFYNEILELTNDLNIDYANKFDFNTLDEAIAYIDTAEGVEGVIVRFIETGKRVKIKTQEYFANHRLATALETKDPKSKSNRLAIANYVLSGNEGDLDDLLSASFYRNAPREFFIQINEIRQEIINTINMYEEFSKNPEQYTALIDNDTNSYQKDMNEIITEINGVQVNRGFLVDFLRALNKFHSKQNDFFLFNDAMKKSKMRGKLQPMFRDVYGTVANYNQLIAPRSFAYKEYSIADYIMRNI